MRRNQLVDMPLEDLLRLTAAADAAAFETFYARTSAKIMSVVLAIVGDRPTAEELLQEIYLRVWSSAATYDPVRGRPMTWLITIARSRAIDRIRAESRRQRRDDSAEVTQIEDPGPSLEDTVELSQTTRRLSACLDEITSDRRQCIQMAYLHGLTHSEIANRLDCPLGTVKSWIRRGLQQLYTCLNR